MFRHIFSLFFKRKECFKIKPGAKKTESSIQQVPSHFTKDGQRLIFIDPHLTEKELKEMYGDAMNS